MAQVVETGVHKVVVASLEVQSLFYQRLIKVGQDTDLGDAPTAKGAPRRESSTIAVTQ